MLKRFRPDEAAKDAWTGTISGNRTHTIILRWSSTSTTGVDGDANSERQVARQ